MHNNIMAVGSKDRPSSSNARPGEDIHYGDHVFYGGTLTRSIWDLALCKMECRKPKRVKGLSYHKENMMMCKQVKHGVPLQAEQADWLAGTDREIDEQELEAHYKCADKRDALANLIANLTLDTEENKTILKQLKKANASLT
ncbi:hypothetical protein Tco_0278664 [Tanacetum coccineum]